MVPPGSSSPDASAASTIRSAIRSFTEPPGLRYSTLASTMRPRRRCCRRAGAPSGPSTRREPQQRGVADQVQERVDVLHAANLTAGRGPPRIRSMGRVGKAAAARKLASAAAYGGGGAVPARWSAVRRAPRRGHRWPAARSASPATRRPRTPPGGTAAAGPGRRSRSPCSATPARPATAWTGSRRRPGPCWPPAWPRPPTGGSTCASSPSSARRPPTWRPQIERALPIEPDVAVILIGANDVTHTVLPSQSVRDLGEGVRRLRAGGRRGGRRHLSRPGHRSSRSRPPLKQVARSWSRRLAAAQTIAVGRGGRPLRLAGLDPGPGVRGGAGAAVRARPVPPVGRRLPLAVAGAPAVGAGRARSCIPEEERARWRPAAARSCCPWRRPPSRPCAPPAPSSTAPRWPAPSAGCAAAGCSCGTGSRRPQGDVETPETAESPESVDAGDSRGLSLAGRPWPAAGLSRRA